MQPRLGKTIWLATAVLVAASLQLAVHSASTVFELPAMARAAAVQGDTVGTHERLLQPLIAALGDARDIGYLSRDGAQFAAEDQGYYFMTQYALAPRRVHRDTKRALVVGYAFANADGTASIRVPPGLALRQDFENGSVLLGPSEP
jgi:hypothetical protein